MSEVFDTDYLEFLARQTGFKVRESKLTPSMFLDAVLFKEANNGVISLEDHCIALKQRYGIDIKKQSLSERFDQSASTFLEALLHHQLSDQITSVIKKENLSKELRHFKSVKVKDSTRFQLPECLKEYYPGSTGNASGAGIHIQFEFDLLGGKGNVLAITDALEQDVNDAIQTKDDIEPGSLFIRDLGYFSTDVLKAARQRGAHYITRARHRMNYYHADTGKKIDFDVIYRQMRKKNRDYIEIPIFIDEQKDRHRLIVEMIPEDEAAKRIAKAGKEARKRGTQLSEEYKSRARLNLFITNVPLEWIPTESVRKIYRLRWQVELRFKAWKSFYHIDATKKMQRYRFECYLYATLLLLMINLEITANYSVILSRHTGRLLSVLKFFKTMSQNTTILREALLERGQKLLSHLAFLYEVSHQKLLLETRKGHTAPLSKVLLEKLV